jgi:hypothetical protein
MAGGKRPGGLTALAVLNFVFGGLSAFGLLAVFAAIAIAKKAADTVQANGGTVDYKGPSLTMLYVGLIISTVTTLLLIISGVGYIGLKKFLGRTLGNLYGVLSLGGSILSIVTGGGLGFFVIIFMIYPLLTLILLNTTFKEDFVN